MPILSLIWEVKEAVKERPGPLLLVHESIVLLNERGAMETYAQMPLDKGTVL